MTMGHQVSDVVRLARDDVTREGVVPLLITDEESPWSRLAEGNPVDTVIAAVSAFPQDGAR